MVRVPPAPRDGHLFHAMLGTPFVLYNVSRLRTFYFLVHGIFHWVERAMGSQFRFLGEINRGPLLILLIVRSLRKSRCTPTVRSTLLRPFFWAVTLDDSKIFAPASCDEERTEERTFRVDCETRTPFCNAFQVQNSFYRTRYRRSRLGASVFACKRSQRGRNRRL